MDQNTSTPAPVQIPTLLIVESGLGLLALSVNVIALLILGVNRNLLKKSAFLVGVIVSNICAALGFAYSRIYFIIGMNYGYISEKATPAYCFATLIPQFFMIAYCLPACVLLMIGAERLLAVSRPTWYRASWSHKRGSCAYALVFAFVLASVGCVCVASYWTGAPDKLTNSCSWLTIIGDDMAGYIYFTSILGGSIAVVCTLISFCIGNYRFGQLAHNASSLTIRAREKKQLRLTKAMLCTASLDFILVVIPTTILCMNYVFHMSVLTDLVNYSVSIYNFNAIANICGQLAFNSEYRRATIKSIRLDRVRCFANKIGLVTTGSQTAGVHGATGHHGGRR